MKKPCEIGTNALKAKKPLQMIIKLALKFQKKFSVFLPFETCVISGSKSRKVVSL